MPSPPEGSFPAEKKKKRQNKKNAKKQIETGNTATAKSTAGLSRDERKMLAVIATIEKMEKAEASSALAAKDQQPLVRRRSSAKSGKEKRGGKKTVTVRASTAAESSSASSPARSGSSSSRKTGRSSQSSGKKRKRAGGGLTPRGGYSIESAVSAMRVSFMLSAFRNLGIRPSPREWQVDGVVAASLILAPKPTKGRKGGGASSISCYATKKSQVDHHMPSPPFRQSFLMNELLRGLPVPTPPKPDSLAIRKGTKAWILRSVVTDDRMEEESCAQDPPGCTKASIVQEAMPGSAIMPLKVSWKVAHLPPRPDGFDHISAHRLPKHDKRLSEMLHLAAVMSVCGPSRSNSKRRNNLPSPTTSLRPTIKAEVNPATSPTSSPAAAKGQKGTAHEAATSAVVAASARIAAGALPSTHSSAVQDSKDPMIQLQQNDVGVGVVPTSSTDDNLGSPQPPIRSQQQHRAPVQRQQEQHGHKHQAENRGPPPPRPRPPNGSPPQQQKSPSGSGYSDADVRWGGWSGVSATTQSAGWAQYNEQQPQVQHQVTPQNQDRLRKMVHPRKMWGKGYCGDSQGRKGFDDLGSVGSSLPPPPPSRLERHMSHGSIRAVGSGSFGSPHGNIRNRSLLPPRSTSGPSMPSRGGNAWSERIGINVGYSDHSRATRNTGTGSGREIGGPEARRRAAIDRFNSADEHGSGIDGRIGGNSEINAEPSRESRIRIHPMKRRMLGHDDKRSGREWGSGDGGNGWGSRSRSSPDDAMQGRRSPRSAGMLGEQGPPQGGPGLHRGALDDRHQAGISGGRQGHPSMMGRPSLMISRQRRSPMNNGGDGSGGKLVGRMSFAELRAARAFECGNEPMPSRFRGTGPGPNESGGGGPGAASPFMQGHRMSMMGGRRGGNMGSRIDPSSSKFDNIRGGPAHVSGESLPRRSIMGGGDRPMPRRSISDGGISELRDVHHRRQQLNEPPSRLRRLNTGGDLREGSAGGGRDDSRRRAIERFNDDGSVVGSRGGNVGGQIQPPSRGNRSATDGSGGDGRCVSSRRLGAHRSSGEGRSDERGDNLREVHLSMSKQEKRRAAIARFQSGDGVAPDNTGGGRGVMSKEERRRLEIRRFNSSTMGGDGPQQGFGTGPGDRGIRSPTGMSMVGGNGRSHGRSSDRTGRPSAIGDDRDQFGRSGMRRYSKGGVSIQRFSSAPSSGHCPEAVNDLNSMMPRAKRMRLERGPEISPPASTTTQSRRAAIERFKSEDDDVEDGELVDDDPPPHVQQQIDGQVRGTNGGRGGGSMCSRVSEEGRRPVEPFASAGSWRDGPRGGAREQQGSGVFRGGRVPPGGATRPPPFMNNNRSHGGGFRDSGRGRGLQQRGGGVLPQRSQKRKQNWGR